RVITAELDVAFVVNVYTPNSGAGLKRLEFRTQDWDEAFAAYVCDLEKIKPVVVVGDMNVAHQDKDFYNPEQKRMRKTAGTTPEERSSFSVKLLGRNPPPSCAVSTTAATTPSGGKAINSQPPSSSPAPAPTGGSSGEKPPMNAEEGGCFLVDTFRERHPDATGVFSYWSVRAGNRAVNRGMRLDYCLASRALVGG
ncbi:unnamed protein product, partial [Hapterophycus canaliculatus]